MATDTSIQAEYLEPVMLGTRVPSLLPVRAPVREWSSSWDRLASRMGVVWLVPVCPPISNRAPVVQFTGFLLGRRSFCTFLRAVKM